MVTAMFLSCQSANGQKDKQKSDMYNQDYEYKDVSTTTKEYITKEVSIYNLNGDIEIKSYNGDKVKVITTTTIKANDQSQINVAKNEIKLGTDNSEELSLYVAEPYDTRPKKQEGKNIKWDEKKYEFFVSYAIELPANTILNLNTVNGDIDVVNINGDIRTNNVNGDINLKDVSKVYKAITVNGDVNVISSNANDVVAEYQTINGDINLSIPATFAGECHFKSLNGDFYTDFDTFEEIGDVKTSKENHQGVTRYKIDKNHGIKIGNGNSKIKFETLNGDVHLRKS